MRSLSELKIFWKDVSVVLTGTVLSQAIPIIGTLFISRIYSPESFGVFSVWLGIVIIISVILTGRLEMSFAIEKDGKPREIGVLVVTMLIAIFSFFLVLIIIFGISLNLFKSLENGLVIYLPIAAAFTGLNATWQAFAIADGKYHLLSYFRLIQSLVTVISQIVFGILNPESMSLVFGLIVGLIISQVYAFYVLPIKLSYFQLNQFYSMAKKFIFKHKNFLIYSLPGDSINSTATQMPLIIVTARFGPEMAGFLALTMRTLGAPFGLMGKSILDVFKRQVTIAYQKYNSCRQEYLYTLKVLSKFSLVFICIFFFSSEKIFILLFGEEWSFSGIIAVWLLPLFALRFISSPLSYMFYLMNKQNWDLLWQIALICITYFTLSFPSEFDISLKAYSLSYSMHYAIYLFLSFKLTKAKM